MDILQLNGSVTFQNRLTGLMAGRSTGLLTGRLTDICYPSGILAVFFQYCVHKLTWDKVMICCIGVIVRLSSIHFLIFLWGWVQG